MVRLTDLPKIDRDHLLSKVCPPFDITPWVDGPPIRERRVVVITTSGIHPPGQPTFHFRESSYRVIPGDTTGKDLVMSHMSVNYDRTGFQQDVNVVFPIDRLREMEEAAEIGSLADYHYSFMGAGGGPEAYENSAIEVARLLKDDKVNAVLFSPV